MRILLLFLLSGCQAYDLVGIASVERLNHHTQQAEALLKDAIDNQGTIAKASQDLAFENLIEAKGASDTEKIIRASATLADIKGAVEKNEELSRRTFDKVPDPPFDWSTILNILIGLATGGTTMGAVVLSLKSKLKSVAIEAIRNGESTDKNDTSHLKKLV